MSWRFFHINSPPFYQLWAPMSRASLRNLQQRFFLIRKISSLNSLISQSGYFIAMSYCQINFRGLRTLGFHLSNYSAMVSVPNFLGSMFSLRFIRGLIIHGFREAKIKLSKLFEKFSPALITLNFFKK